MLSVGQEVKMEIQAWSPRKTFGSSVGLVATLGGRLH
jgi:hypothetical protein